MPGDRVNSAFLDLAGLQWQLFPCCIPMIQPEHPGVTKSNCAQNNEDERNDKQGLKKKRSYVAVKDGSERFPENGDGPKRDS